MSSNILIHFYSQKLPPSYDYRVEKENHLIRQLSLGEDDVYSVDIHPYTLEKDHTSYVNLLAYLRSIGKVIASRYPLPQILLALSGEGLKDMISAMTTILDSTVNAKMEKTKQQQQDIVQGMEEGVASTSSTSSSNVFKLKLIFLEDLFFIDRSYVYENKHLNFLKQFQSLSRQFDRIQLETILSSTNEELNTWGEGDCKVMKAHEVITQSERLWQTIMKDVPFEEMHNQGHPVPRLISIQLKQHPLYGRPLYRHPNDQEPENLEMQPIIAELLEIVSKYTGCTQLNHVLVQHYRDGKDTIAAHSDKTLDVDRNCPIVNLSLGSTRYLYLQKKENKAIFEKIPLRHGDIFLIGMKTNQLWYHEIPKEMQLIPHPLFGTSRVSLTFRAISTFLYESDNGRQVVIGQGSPYKTIDDVDRIGPVPERSRADLIQSFSRENKQASEFDWQKCYGEGFLLR
eukprot:gene4580-5020_t